MRATDPPPSTPPARGRGGRVPSGALVLRAAALAAAVLLAGPARAGADAWEPYPPGKGGPWGGSVRRVVGTGSGDLWAATAGGVFLSEDGGDTWAEAGLPGLEVVDLAACPDGSALWAAVAGDGLYRGEPVPGEGAAWERAAEGRFVGVAADPGGCTAVFAVLETAGTDRLTVSTDGGTSWVDRGAFPTVSRIVATSSGGAALGTQAGEIYLLDGPLAQARLLYGHPEGVGVEDLAVAGQALVASLGGAGLRVLDLGDPDAPPVEIADFAPGNEFGFAEALALDPADPARVVYFVNGSPTGVYELDLGDPAGEPEEIALPEAGLLVNTVLVTGEAEWLGTNEAGLLRRSRGSGAFELASRGLRAFDARAVAFSPDGSGGIAVGGGARHESGNGGVALWDPGTSRWARAGEGSLPPGSAGLVVYRGDEVWVGMDGLGLFSRRPGEPWLERTGSFPSVSDRQTLGALAFDPGRPDLLVAGALVGLYRTGNAGLSWEAGEGVPPATQQAWQVAAAPDGFLAAGTGTDGAGAVLRSTDGGRTWSRWNDTPLPGIVALDVSRRGTGLVLAGTVAGVWLSRDGGRTWARAADVPASGRAGPVAVADVAGDAWMAAFVQGEGVFASTDGGSTWIPTGADGLADANGRVPLVHALAFEPGRARAVAAVHDRGLWYLDLEDTALPAGTVALGAGGVQGREVTLELTALTDVAEVALSNDLRTWSGWREVAPSVAWELSGDEGARAVYVRFRSAAGVESATYAVVVGVPDTVAPEPVLEGVPEAETPSTGATIRVTGDDVVEYRFRLDGGDFPETWIPADQPIVLSGLAEGTHLLEVEARDEAGNTALTSAQWTVTPESGGGEEPPSGGGGGGGGGCFVQTLGEALR